MEVSPSRHSTQPHLRSSGTSPPRMQAAIPLRPSASERVELPSIRTAVPEINRVSGKTAVSDYRGDGISSSPKGGLGTSSTPDYPTSPPSYNKRRRLSSEEDQELEWERSGIKRHRSPSGPTHRSQSVAISPTSSLPQSNILSSESWSSSSRSSPYLPARGYSGVRSPPYDASSTFEPPVISRGDWRPTLPSLLNLDRGPSQVPRGHTNEYALDSSRSGARTYPQMLTSAFDPPISSYHQPAFSYGYQQPRVQSYSGPSGPPLSHDRTPFSNSHQAMYPGSNFPYGMSDSGHDSKQRKRRGNLPKETTDKLRSWFVSHLQHPYPTEDEKQDLMRETGLQINQISNWFINARRRQLPNMISNARAESDARAAREGGGNAVGENTSDYGEEKQSEGEGSGYDDDFDRPRHGIPKRESI